MNMFLYKYKYKYVQLFSFPIYKSVVGHGSGNQTPANPKLKSIQWLHRWGSFVGMPAQY